MGDEQPRALSLEEERKLAAAYERQMERAVAGVGVASAPEDAGPTVDLKAALEQAIASNAARLTNELTEEHLQFDAARLTADFACRAEGMRRALRAFHATPPLTRSESADLVDFLEEEAARYVGQLVTEATDRLAQEKAYAASRLLEWRRVKRSKFANVIDPEVAEHLFGPDSRDANPVFPTGGRRWQRVPSQRAQGD